MTATTAEEQGRTTDNRARIRLTDGPLAGPVLCRVVSMILARAEWPMDRLDDAMLVCDALCAHAHAYASDGHLTFSVRAMEHEAELRVGELAPGGATGLMRDAMLPGVGNVLERIAESLSIEREEQGAGSQLVVMLSPD